MKKKEWTIEISQNGWEYSGYAFVTAAECVRVDERSIRADGVLIKFDEPMSAESPYIG